MDGQDRKRIIHLDVVTILFEIMHMFTKEILENKTIMVGVLVVSLIQNSGQLQNGHIVHGQVMFIGGIKIINNLVIGA